jgi:hypothetical protein
MFAALKWQAALVFVLALGIAAFSSAAIGQTVSGPRAQALHECSTKAAKHKEYTEETAYLATYRTCMTEHGQAY